MWAISSLIPPCTSVIAATSRGDSRRLGEAEVEEHVRAAVDGKSASAASIASTCSCSAREVRRLGALGGEHGGADLDRDPVVEQVAPVALAELDRGCASAIGGASATNVPPRAAAQRDQVAALGQRRDRLAQRRARDAELVGELALGRQAVARPEQAEPDRRAQALDGLLERRRRLDRPEDRRDSQALGERGGLGGGHGDARVTRCPAVRGGLTRSVRAGTVARRGRICRDWRRAVLDAVLAGLEGELGAAAASRSRSTAASRTATSACASAGATASCACPARTPSCSASTARPSAPPPPRPRRSASGPRCSRSSPSRGCLVTRFIDGAPGGAPRSCARRLDGGRPARCARSTPARRCRARSTPGSVVDAYRATARERGGADPGRLRRSSRGGAARDRARRSTGPEHAPVPVPQRPADRELPRTTASALRILDWEYAGMGDRYFDLGNLVGQQRLRRGRRRAAARGLLRRAVRRRGASPRCA